MSRTKKKNRSIMEWNREASLMGREFSEAIDTSEVAKMWDDATMKASSSFEKEITDKWSESPIDFPDDDFEDENESVTK